MIQGAHKVNPFDIASFGMVVMPADALVLVRVGLFGDTVVDDEHAIVSLYRSHMRLHDLPQVGGREHWPSQEPLHLIMAETAFEQFCQTCSRGWPEGTDQIITVDVQQFSLVHAFSLYRVSHQLRNMSD